MTNIPLPDLLADELRAEAQAEGLSVPDLLAKLLQERREALRRRESQNYLKGEALTQKLDAVYEKETSSIDPALLHLQLLSIDKEEW